MRTKIGKRIGPVPIAAVAVFALAAFLSAGLLLIPNGAPTAEAADPDCTVQLAADGSLPGTDIECDAVGDTAVVEFKTNDADTTDDGRPFSLLIEDKGGPITAYPQGATWSNDAIQVGGANAKAKKYRLQTIEVPKPQANPNTGAVEGQSVTVTVKGSLRAWAGSGSVTSDIGSIPDDNALDGSRSVATGGLAVDITFLGAAALGKDGADFNRKVDDAILDQCVLGGTGNPATSTRLLGEATTGGCDSSPPKPTTPADLVWQNSTAVTDMVETRSKLVIRTGTAILGATNAADATVIFDGGTKTHTVTGTGNAEVTIFALVQDADGDNIYGATVDFEATTVPAGIVAARDLSDDPVTKIAVATAPSTANAKTQIHIANLSVASTAEGSMVSGEAVITHDNDNDGATLDGDAVATFTLDDLPAKDTDSYIVTVVAKVGDLTLGTVKIARTGAADAITADTYNLSCLTDTGRPTTAAALETYSRDYTDDIFNMKNDGCMADDRFGRGQQIVVKTQLEDARDLPVDGDLDVDVEDVDDPISYNTPALAAEMASSPHTKVWVYTVDADAAYGEHDITLSSEEDDVADVVLPVTIAGPPKSYRLDGPDTIELGSFGTFTVTATDDNGGIPHFTTIGTKKDDTVSVVAPDIAASLLYGADLMNGVLTLDDATGMSSFIIYAPSNAMGGDTARIFVRRGDVQLSHLVTFGTKAPEPPAGLTAPSGVKAAAFTLFGAKDIQVTWTPGANAEGHYVALLTEDLSELAEDVVPLGSDAGSYKFSNVASGTYQVAVISWRIGDDGMIELGYEFDDFQKVTLP